MTRATTFPEAVRESVGRLQRQGEHAVARFRRDAGTVVARQGAAVVKELRLLEHRLMRALHAATTDQVGRLERRVATLEQAFEERFGSGREE